MTQLAIRFLAQEAERSEMPTEEFSRRIKREIRGIAIVWAEPEHVLANAARMYILQIDMVADRFFRSLRDDVKVYKRPAVWTDRDGKEKLGSLAQLLVNMAPGHAARVRASTAFALVDYYRLVRNDIALCVNMSETHASP